MIDKEELSLKESCKRVLECYAVGLKNLLAPWTRIVICISPDNH